MVITRATSAGDGTLRSLAGPLVVLLLAGCGDEAIESQQRGVDLPADPTWELDVAPLLSRHCIHCHNEGGIAPFSLETAEEAEAWGPAIVSSVKHGTMPPFLASESEECPQPFDWVGDLRLTERERAVFTAWQQSGFKRGRGLAKLRSTARRLDLERVDLRLQIPQPVVVEGTEDSYRCFVVDPGLDRDVYVSGRQVRSGNDRILHHLVAFVVRPRQKPDGTMQSKSELEAEIRAARGAGIGGSYDCFGDLGLDEQDIEQLEVWTQGVGANIAPDGGGQLISRDSLVVMNTHHHPTGTTREVDDDTTLDLQFMDVIPAELAFPILLGVGNRPAGPYLDMNLVPNEGETEGEFVIPAGARDHTETIELTWKNLQEGTRFRVFELGPHMHNHGVRFRAELVRSAPTRGEPKRRCLIELDRWSFDWQRGYRFAADRADLPVMENGDKLVLSCTYDNPGDEPVYAGGAATEEMCLLGLGVRLPNFTLLDQ